MFSGEIVYKNLGTNSIIFHDKFGSLDRKTDFYLKTFSGINSRATRRCNTAPYHYSVYWLPTARSVL